MIKARRLGPFQSARAGGRGCASIRIREATKRPAIMSYHLHRAIVGPGERMDVALAGLLLILGAALFVYLSYTLISRL